MPPIAGGLGYLSRINSGLSRLGLGIPGRAGTWALERMRQDVPQGQGADHGLGGALRDLLGI